MAVSQDNKRIIITLPVEIYEKLEKTAKSENRSISNMGSTIIIKYLEQNNI